MVKTYIYNNVLVLLLLGTACLSSCTADFDFLEAQRANPEFAYRESFESEFGTISPDQSWDFTLDGNTETRAAGDNITITPSWYNVENSTLRYIQTNLTLGQDHSDLGHPFAMTVPESGEVTVYPIYQGTGTSWELHMVSGSEDYKIWEKGQTISGGADNGMTYLQKDAGKNCPTCKGKGYTEKKEPIGKWEPKKVYSICVTHKLAIFSNDYYLNGTGSGFPRTCKKSTTEQKRFAVLNIGDKNYLYYIDGDNSGFVTVVNNLITIERSYSTPLDSDVNTNGYGDLIIGGRFLGASGAIGSLYLNGLVASASKGNSSVFGYSYQWRWKAVDATKEQEAAINSSVKREKCTTCDGTGIVLHSDTDADKWTNVQGNPNPSGTVLNSSTVDAKQVRSRGIKVSGLTSGEAVYFYAKINNNGNNSSYFAASSIIASSSNYMMVLNNPPTVNTSLIDGNEYVMLTVEDREKANGEDISEYQSAVFVISADEINELTVTNGSFVGPGSSESKRYMVEDLGAVTTSDIDFNDVVFDIVANNNYRYTVSKSNKTVHPVGMSRTTISGTQKLYVRAMGGTMDFKIKVGDNEVFQKGDYTKNGTRNPHYTDPNADISGRFESDVMYNTGKKSLNNFYDSDTYLAEVTFSGSYWNPSQNNVKVIVSNKENSHIASTPSGYDVDNDGYGNRIISFPYPGEVPAMIAVPINQKWNHEQVNAIKNHGIVGCYLKLQELAK